MDASGSILFEELAHIAPHTDTQHNTHKTTHHTHDNPRTCSRSMMWMRAALFRLRSWPPGCRSRATPSRRQRWVTHAAFELCCEGACYGARSSWCCRSRATPSEVGGSCKHFMVVMLVYVNMMRGGKWCCRSRATPLRRQRWAEAVTNYVFQNQVCASGLAGGKEGFIA